jgi:hypothetical protein
MRAKEQIRKKKRRRGRPPKHGGYSLLTRGEMPENRRYIAEYLAAVREGLIQDLGPSEEELTTAQRVLIDRVVTKLGIVRLIEENAKETGIFRKGKLDSSLGLIYLRYDNSVKLQLQALGVDQRAAEKILSPLELAKSIDARENEQEE